MLEIPRHTSDHDAALAFIVCHKWSPSSFKREVWLYDKIDVSRFEDKISNIDWEQKLGVLNDVDEMCEEFVHQIVFRDCKRLYSY